MRNMPGRATGTIPTCWSWARSAGAPRCTPRNLKPDEQITHISLWCLLSSPLLIGCDMSSMDEFTVAVLTNDEVLDINQDPLGKPAGRILKNGQTEVWARPLLDGTTAVGLFNRGSQAAKVKVSWSDLEGPRPASRPARRCRPVRDLWQHKDLGEQADGYEATVPPHGTVLVKVGKGELARITQGLCAVPFVLRAGIIAAGALPPLATP